MTLVTGPPGNLVYQTYTDPADIAGAVQDLADSVDLAVQAAYDAQTAGIQRPTAVRSTAAVQSIPNNTDTLLTWSAVSEVYDNDNMATGDPTSILTFNTAGTFLVNLNILYGSIAATGTRQMSITHSVLGLVGRNIQPGVSSNTAAINMSVVVPADVGDTVEFRALQTSGSSLNVGRRIMSATRLS